MLRYIYVRENKKSTKPPLHLIEKLKSVFSTVIVPRSHQTFSKYLANKYFLRLAVCVLGMIKKITYFLLFEG